MSSLDNEEKSEFKDEKILAEELELSEEASPENSKIEAVRLGMLDTVNVHPLNSLST